MADRPSGIPKKRHRIPLSCESCRLRKLKCDRQKPCLNCLSRDLSCVFANGTASRQRSGRTHAPQQSEDLKSKLQRLEQLVSAIAENSGVGDDLSVAQQDTPPKTDGDNSSDASSPEFEAGAGHLIAAQRGSHYVGPSSWETVLHDIADIREHLEDLPNVLEDKSPLSARRNPALLGGVSTDVSLKELIEGLPSRVLADRLVARFFDHYDPAMPSRQMLHKPTFLKQYDNFWQTKDTGFCPFLLSTYYAVFCLALQSYFYQDEEPSDLRGRCKELSNLFRTRAAQACLKSDVTAPTRRAVEAMLMCTICEYSRLSEGFIGQYLLLGILMRKALYMGLHRDPNEFTALSPFEKELRRRLWAHIWQIDMLYSFQLGLPNTTHNYKANVSSPRNLFEEELTEDMKALPPARPVDEETPIGFTIAKLHLMRAIGAIVEHLNHPKGYNFDEVGELNRQLQNAHAAVPEHLRVQPMEKSHAATRSLRLQRLQLQMFYDKAACMLNRGFIAVSKHKFSMCMRPRAFCVEAALDLLRIQEMFEFEQCKWWLFYLTKHDFLLAATILYLVLFTNKKELALGTNLHPGFDEKMLHEEEVRITQALKRSREIWDKLVVDDESEARQACRMFDSMHRQLQNMNTETTPAVLQPLRAPVPVAASMMDLKLEDMATLETVAPSGFESFTNASVDRALENGLTDFDWSLWENAMQIPDSALEGVDGLWSDGAANGLGAPY